ncbi:MAG: hypothetical protein E7381_01615 [Clostridiales bacterium]|nr:hypothetical protein [Clostridiales bacterium]
MKNKKIVLGSLFYFIGGIVESLLSIALFIFELLSLIFISPKVNPTITALYYGFPITTIACIVVVVGMGYIAFQFTIFTKDGIRVRCLWGTIRYLKWEEIKEVRNERFYVSVQGGFTSGWYLFDDGVERVKRSGIIKKNTHITIPANKRNKKIIEEFWQGEIKEILKKD